jgi:hypothetical protein
LALSIEPVGTRTILFLLVAPAGTCPHRLQDDLILIGQREVPKEAQISLTANRGMMRLHDLLLHTSTMPGPVIGRKQEQLHYQAEVR